MKWLNKLASVGMASLYFVMPAISAPMHGGHAHGGQMHGGVGHHNRPGPSHHQGHQHGYHHGHHNGYHQGRRYFNRGIYGGYFALPGALFYGSITSPPSQYYDYCEVYYRGYWIDGNLGRNGLCYIFYHDRWIGFDRYY